MTDDDTARRVFRWDDLTFGEAELLEDLTGQPIEELLEGGIRGAKALKAAAWIVARRDDPDVTLDDIASRTIITGPPRRQEDDQPVDPPSPADAPAG